MREPRPNYSPEPDPTRKTFELQGVFQWAARSIGLGMGDIDFSSRDPRMTVLRQQLRQPLNQNDVLVYLCEGGADLTPGEMFQITDIKPDGVSGVFLDLVQFGVQSGASDAC